MKYLFIFYAVFIASQLCGQQLAWSDTIHYWTDTGISGVTTDSQGNVYAVGDMAPSYKFNGGGHFIRKYSTNGNLIWKDSSSAGFGTHCNGIVADHNNNVYLPIYMPTSTISIGATTYSTPAVYLLKYNSQGQIQWVKTQENGSEPYAITIDKYDYIRMSGAWSGGGFITKYNTAGVCIDTLICDRAFSMGQDTLCNTYVMTTYNSSSPIYFRKYDSSGTISWMIPGPAAIIATDKSGNFYATSQGNTNATSPLDKLSNNGQLQWSVTVPFWGGCAICTDKYENVYVAGYNTNNTVIVKYTPQGVQTWSMTLPFSTPSGVCVDGDNVYLIANSGYPKYDGYLVKITQPSQVSVHEITSSLSTLNVFPNPSGSVFNFSYKAEELEKINVKITDAGGKLVQCRTFSSFTGELTEKVDLSGFAPGIYFLEISSDTHREVKKLVVQ